MKVRKIKLLFELLTVVFTTACGSGEKPPPIVQPTPIVTTKVGRFDNAQERQNVRALNSETASTCFRSNSSSLIDVDYRQTRDNFPVKHRIIRNQQVGRFTLDLKIAVKVMPESTSQGRRDQMLLEASSCIPKMQNVFNRYGIDLSISIDLDIGQATANHDRHVLYTDSVGGSTTNNWYYQGFGSADGTDELCLTITHETGHYFSLEDDYRKPFPLRETNPISIMDDPSYEWEYLDFFPRHIQSILAPACPDFARQQGWRYPPEMQFTVRYP